MRQTPRRLSLEFGERERPPIASRGDRDATWRNASGLGGRAQTAWKHANAKRAEQELDPLDPITLHECRHTYASLMIAAGVNAKALGSFMGHSSITITLDRYGHLMPGAEDEAAALLDAYLDRANTQARLAQVTATPDRG